LTAVCGTFMLKFSNAAMLIPASADNKLKKPALQRGLLYFLFVSYQPSFD
jgi:hypothetical protein